MIKFEEEKDNLTKKLSEQYSRNIINIEEYERILEYINKIETVKEISIIETIIRENNVKDGYELMMPKENAMEKHLAAFSWKTSNIKPHNGNGGKYISLFGANRIIIENLPPGRTIINVNSIFGLTEIIISKNTKITNKITPIFSGIFGSNEMNYPAASGGVVNPTRINEKDGALPELYIIGKAIFGNITIVRNYTLTYT